MHLPELLNHWGTRVENNKNKITKILLWYRWLNPGSDSCILGKGFTDDVCVCMCVRAYSYTHSSLAHPITVTVSPPSTPPSYPHTYLLSTPDLFLLCFPSKISTEHSITSYHKTRHKPSSRLAKATSRRKRVPSADQRVRDTLSHC